MVRPLLERGNLFDGGCYFQSLWCHLLLTLSLELSLIFLLQLRYIGPALKSLKEAKDHSSEGKIMYGVNLWWNRQVMNKGYALSSNN